MALTISVLQKYGPCKLLHAAVLPLAIWLQALYLLSSLDQKLCCSFWMSPGQSQLPKAIMSQNSCLQMIMYVSQLAYRQTVDHFSTHKLCFFLTWISTMTQVTYAMHCLMAAFHELTEALTFGIWSLYLLCALKWLSADPCMSPLVACYPQYTYVTFRHSIPKQRCLSAPAICDRQTEPTLIAALLCTWPACILRLEILDKFEATSLLTEPKWPQYCCNVG